VLQEDLGMQATLLEHRLDSIDLGVGPREPPVVGIQHQNGLAIGGRTDVVGPGHESRQKCRQAEEADAIQRAATGLP
jgi:hypothetical protein